MNGLQKLGGIGALLQGAAFVIILVTFFVVLPGQGITAIPNDLENPAKVLPAVANQLLLTIGLWGVEDLIFAMGLIVAVAALYYRLQAPSASVMGIATIAGVIATGLFLANAMVGIFGIQELAGLYAQNPALAASAFLPIILMRFGLGFGGVFAYGWWVFLASWVALQARWLPRVLNYLGLLFGVLSILSVVIPPLGFLGPIVGIVWVVWLGIILLRQPARMTTQPGTTM